MVSMEIIILVSYKLFLEVENAEPDMISMPYCIHHCVGLYIHAL